MNLISRHNLLNHRPVPDIWSILKQKSVYAVINGNVNEGFHSAVLVSTKHSYSPYNSNNRSDNCYVEAC